MLGNCPVCKKKIKKEELKNLKNFESARCFGCGKLFINHPFYVVMFCVFMVAFPFVMPYLNSKTEIILSMIFTFIMVAFYNEIKVLLPLIEDK